MMETTSFDIFYSGYRVVLYYSLNKVPLQVVFSEPSVPLKKYQGYDRFHMSILLYDYQPFDLIGHIPLSTKTPNLICVF